MSNLAALPYQRPTPAVSFDEAQRILTDSARKVRRADAPTRPSVAKEEIHIVLPSGDVSITKSAEKIFSLIGRARVLFYRGRRVHEILANPDGTRHLKPITPAQFRSRIDDFGLIYAWRTGANGEPVLKPTRCSEDTARALLESRPARELLPNVASLVSCPVLANVGGEMRLLGPGYHSVNGGLFVTGGEMPPTVPLSEAVASLKDILGDFDFASPGDCSRALASMISPALRFGGWLKNQLPIDIAEADASQAGKGYRQKCIAAIYREMPNMIVQRNGGVGSVDENISQKAIDGRPFILFDNFRGRFDSSYLEAILTGDGTTMSARIPHHGEVQVDPRGFVFSLTSNGVETTRDLANRGSIIRIRKRPDSYGFKAYAEGDLLDHIVANQPHFLGCVFAIIAEWVANDQPRTSETRHNFREWAQTLDWIVQKIFAAAPLMDGHEDARQRVSDPGRTWLRALYIALRNANRTGDLHAIQIAEFALENELVPPGVRPDADEAIAARKIGSLMAAFFGDGDEVKIDGFQIHRARVTSPSTGNPSFTYRFDLDKNTA